MGIQSVKICCRNLQTFICQLNKTGNNNSRSLSSDKEAMLFYKHLVFQRLLLRRSSGHARLRQYIVVPTGPASRPVAPPPLLYSLQVQISSISNCIKLTIMYSRGQQSLARGPNPACEFRPSGPRRLVSFNIKFGPENVPNDERLLSH